MKVLACALKHGVAERSIRHAVEYSWYAAQERAEPPKIIAIGVDECGRAIEVAYTIDAGEVVVFHAMVASRAFRSRVERARRRQK